MPLVEFATDLVFGGLYGALTWLIALAVAIPYAAWQGIRWLGRSIGGTDDGDTRTG
jgi:hypothetical protein